MDATNANAEVPSETMDRNEQNNYGEIPMQRHHLHQIPEEEEFENANTQNTPKSYKGFTTSMDSLFTDPEDCCVFFCFGLFLSTKTRYLYTNEFHDQENNPYQGYKYYCTALTKHYIIPFFLFYISLILIAFGMGVGFLLLIVWVVYMVYIVKKLVKDRVHFRRSMLDKIRSRNDGNDAEVSQLQGIRDEKLSNDAHQLCCGCYPIDDEDDDYPQTRRRQGQYHATSTTDDMNYGEEQTKNYEEESNFCINVWKSISYLCCGKLCKAWCMCCGVCALAQESREIKHLIPKSKHYIDIYTFQPFTEYYPKILELRQSYNQSFSSHISAISTLSSKMMKRYGYLLFMCAVIASLQNEMDSLLVLLATFLQALIIIYFIQWKNNRFIVSIDAIIKYFTLGFIFSTTLAQLFEQLIQTALTISYVLPYAIFDYDEINDLFQTFLNNSATNGYGYNNNDYGYNYDDNDLLLDDYYYDSFSNSTSSNSTNDSDVMKERMEQVAKSHPILFVSYFFFLSFVVAAVTEELCKYFGYLVLTHPENIPEMNIVGSAEGMPSIADTNDAITSNEIEMSTINRNTQIDDGNFTIDDDDNGDNEILNDSRITIPSSEQDQRYGESLETIRLRTMIHMVTVATGFACCENISYIFGLAKDVNTEILILVMRSLLPVHPICAAIQSIGVTKRNLIYNNDSNSNDNINPTAYTKSNYNIGRIILPSVILHGSFDFFLFFLGYIDLYVCGEDVEIVDDDIAASKHTCSDTVYTALNVLGYATPFLFVFFGMLYYFVQARMLKRRLREIDLNSATNVSGLL